MSTHDQAGRRGKSRIGPCEVVGCGTPIKANGLCSKHYQRSHKHGSTNEPVRRSDADRFRAFVDSSNGPCWSWKGAKMPSGRGVFSIGGRNILAYRAAWLLFHGPIPHGLLVCHKCDNPECANPDHLFVGTHKDNMADCKAKGRLRRNPVRGEEASAARLTEPEVLRIRAAPVSVKNTELAALFGVTPATIGHIKKRKTWKHI